MRLERLGDDAPVEREVPAAAVGALPNWPFLGVSVACLRAFAEAHEALLAGATTEDVLAEYREHDLLRGRTVRVHHRTREEDDPRDYEATVLRVDPQGMLCVRRPDGAEQALSGEEVSITPRGV